MRYFLALIASLVFLTCTDKPTEPKKGENVKATILQLPCPGCRTDWVTLTLQDCWADLKDCQHGEVVRYWKKSTFTIGGAYGYELLEDQLFKDQNGNNVYLEAGTKFCYKQPYGGCFIPDCACYPFYPCRPGGCAE
jgi:hypothetical protein